MLILTEDYYCKLKKRFKKITVKIDGYFFILNFKESYLSKESKEKSSLKLTPNALDINFRFDKEVLTTPRSILLITDTSKSQSTAI